MVTSVMSLGVLVNLVQFQSRSFDLFLIKINSLSIVFKDIL